MLLTIAIITRNRSAQLIQAINSCLECSLPAEFEIFVLDNASTDDTPFVLENYKKNHPGISFDYISSKKNLGVGGGRSFCFDKAKGKYVYFLDDDAYIEDYCRDSFFMNSLAFLDSNPNVASLSTAVNDKYLGLSRNMIKSKKRIGGLLVCFEYTGGSHFLRKSSFSSPLYYDIMYGGEELAPTIKAYNSHFYNVINNDISIFHNPLVNKWENGSNTIKNIQKLYCINNYLTKKALYPKLFLFPLYLVFKLRMRKYFGKNERKAIIKETKALSFDEKNPKERIKISTVFRLLWLFGMRAL